MTRLMSRSGVLAATALTLCASVPAHATIGCWNETQVAAAKVRDLQSRLMVATMRCRAMGVDVTHAYNRFVVANRSTLQGANGVILSQFRSGFGSDAQQHYDRFTTQLANAYGGDDTDPWICAETEELADEAANAEGDVERLIALADAVRSRPSLPGGRCGISFEPVAAEPIESAGLEPVDAAPIPSDRWDEVETIPAPSEPMDEAEVEPVAPPRAPAEIRPLHPAPRKIDKNGVQSHI